MRNTKLTTLILCSLLMLAAGPLTAAPSPQERLAQLRPTYEALQTDARFLAFGQRMEGRLDDQELIDEYLRFMPMSPLDFLKLDMKTRHYQFGIPKIISEWHARWIAFHEDLARDLYGDEHVDSRLAGRPADIAAQVEGDAASRATTVGTNRNVAATFSPAPEDYQGEIQVVVNPNNTNQIVAAANTWDTIGGSCAGGIQAVFYSADGGVTWGYTCPPDHTAYPGMSCTGTVLGSDPALAWNDDNEVFLNHMMLCFLGVNNIRFAMVVARSADGGANWSAQGVIKNSWGTTNIEDKNFYIVDNTATSPFYGRHYTCWDRDNNEKMAWSSNNGASWNEVDLPASSGNGTGSRFDLGCDLAVGSGGTVHVVFNTLSCETTCNNEEMFYTRSTNGGANWSTPVEVRDFNLVAFSSNSCPDAQNERCIGPFGGIAVDNSGGACDGNLYATFGDFTSGDGNNSDVWVSRSTNNGASWSAPVLVNDDGIANRIQFHSFVQVDQSNGAIVVGWHDARNDAGNDAIDYFVARSTDCGLTYEANIQVSQPSSEFNNSAISYSNENTADNPNSNPNQYGEYMGVDAVDGKAYLAWSDTRHFFPSSTSESQAENLGFAVVDFGGDGCTTAPNGMIAWWPFDEVNATPFTGSVADVQGGHNGDPQGSVNGTSGEVASAASFGDSSFVEVSDDNALDRGASPNGDFTIDAWFDLRGEFIFNDEPTERVVVDKFDAASQRGYSLFLDDPDNDGDGTFQLTIADGITSVFSSGVEVTSDGWHHIAVTVDRSEATGGRWYLDGQEIVLAGFDPSVRSGSLANSMPLRMGKLNNGRPWSLDEVEIFGRALSGPQVAAIYLAGPSGKCKVDVWVEDTPYDTPAAGPVDTGVEPDPLPSSTPMWKSRSIWVLDGTNPALTCQNTTFRDHDDPEFGQPNLVCVAVSNRGGAPASNVPVEVYWADASLSLDWGDPPLPPPSGNWHPIPAATILTLAPNRDTVVELTWTDVPEPKPNKDHFCLVARLDITQDPITFRGRTDINQAIRLNNNLSWRNVNVVNLLFRVRDEVHVVVRNLEARSAAINLVFNEDEGFVRSGGRLLVDLGDLFAPWQEAGERGRNVTPAGGTRVQLTATPATIRRIPMTGGQEENIGLMAEALEPMPGEGVSRPFNLDVVQRQGGEEIGGVSYVLLARGQDADSDGDGIPDIRDDDDDNDGTPDDSDEDPLDPSVGGRVCPEGAGRALASGLHYPIAEVPDCPTAIREAVSDMTSFHYRSACQESSGGELPDIVLGATVTRCEVSPPGSSGNVVVDVEVCCPTSNGPDLSIAKALTGGFRGPRDEVRWQFTIDVTNLGAAATRRAVRVRDTLPRGLRLLSAEGEGWRCRTRRSRRAICNYPASKPGIEPGESSSITLTVTATREGFRRLRNCATLTSPDDDLPGNNRGCVVLPCPEFDDPLVHYFPEGRDPGFCAAAASEASSRCGPEQRFFWGVCGCGCIDRR